jgi:hypothetical protein
MNNTHTYPLGIVGGDNYDRLVDLLERLCTGEPVGTEEDEMLAAGLLKYTLVTNQCCSGGHFDSLLTEIGYEKKGGVYV